MTKIYRLRSEWTKELDSRINKHHRNLRYAWQDYVMKRKGGYKSPSVVIREKIAGRALRVYARLMNVESAYAEVVESEVYWEDD